MDGDGSRVFCIPAPSLSKENTVEIVEAELAKAIEPYEIGIISQNNNGLDIISDNGIIRIWRYSSRQWK